jgi:hypothetical protein
VGMGMPTLLQESLARLELLLQVLSSGRLCMQ